MEAGWKDGKATGQEEKQRAVGDNPEDCPVCLTAFDDDVQRPRNLPCGHTFCTLCINGLKEQGQVTCPTCRIRHTVPEAGHFPICYTLEAVIKRLRDTALASASPPPCGGKCAGEAGKPGQKGVAGLSRSMHSLLQEQEAKVQAAITACQEVQSQLDKYQTTLTDWHDLQQQLEDKLQAIIDDSKSSRLLMRQEKSKVVDKKKQVQEGQQKLHTVLDTLQKVNTEKEAGMAVVDVLRCTDDTEQRLEECQENFPDPHAVTTARKVMAASYASLEAFKSVLAALETTCAPTGAAGSECNLQAAPTSTIMDRLQALQVQILKVEDLRTLTQPSTSLLQAGLVFATHKTEGPDRHSRISIKNGRLYLHCLQDQTVPPGAAILKMDEVLPASPPCLVFLDLAWPGSSPRRVLIRLSPDTPMGRQFVLLCTGQRGPCYVNTRLLGVNDKGQPGEWVKGGDYDGAGGTALLPDLDKGEYRKSGLAGTVCRVYRGDESVWNAWFGIYTRDCHDDGSAAWVFGEVVDGLEGVAAAAQHRPITEVTVVDCGVVLWS